MYICVYQFTPSYIINNNLVCFMFTLFIVHSTKDQTKEGDEKDEIVVSMSEESIGKLQVDDTGV